MDNLYPAGLAIQIAKIKVHLDCNNQRVFAALAGRYQQFLSDTSEPAQLNVHLETEYADTRCDLGSAIPQYRAGCVNIVGEGYKGWIDLDNRHGALELRSKHVVDEIDYFLRIVYAWLSFKAGGILFHAAGVRRNGMAYVFFGPSGAGKTTAARFSARYEVLNDDLLLLAPEGDQWWAVSTPFTNPTQVTPAPGSAPLAGLYRLVKDEHVFLETLGAAEAVAEILACVPIIASAPECAVDLFARCRSLAGAEPVYQLHFRKDSSFWDLLQ